MLNHHVNDTTSSYTWTNEILKFIRSLKFYSLCNPGLYGNSVGDLELRIHQYFLIIIPVIKNYDCYFVKFSNYGEFCCRPTDSSFIPTVMSRYRQLLLPALKLCLAVLTSLGIENRTASYHVSSLFRSIYVGGKAWNFRLVTAKLYKGVVVPYFLWPELSVADNFSQKSDLTKPQKGRKNLSWLMVPSTSLCPKITSKFQSLSSWFPVNEVAVDLWSNTIYHGITISIHPKPI